MERAAIPEAERKDFYLYVDEFQNVVTQTFENILSEARKYALNLTIAHQYVGQILPKVHQAVLGNCGSVITFRIGGEDAVKMKGKIVEWKSPAGKIIAGKISDAHGNKGLVRAIFESGLPGQAIADNIEVK